MARRPTRADDLRSTEERYVVNDAATSPLYVCDPSEIPPDMEYRWVRETVRGYVDEDNVLNKTRNGWTPVPASRHSAYSAGSLFPGMKPLHDDNSIIRHSGLVLCEKPKRLVDAERNRRQREHMEIMQSTPGLEAMPGGYVRENRQSISQAQAAFQD